MAAAMNMITFRPAVGVTAMLFGDYGRGSWDFASLYVFGKSTLYFLGCDKVQVSLSLTLEHNEILVLQLRVGLHETGQTVCSARQDNAGKAVKYKNE